MAGNMLLNALEGAGNLLDLPGSVVRDAFALKNPLDQFLTPFSSKNRTTGRDLLRQYGAVGKDDTWGNFWAGAAVDALTGGIGDYGALKLGGRALKALRPGASGVRPAFQGARAPGPRWNPGARAAAPRGLGDEVVDPTRILRGEYDPRTTDVTNSLGRISDYELSELSRAYDGDLGKYDEFLPEPRRRTINDEDTEVVSTLVPRKPIEVEDLANPGSVKSIPGDVVHRRSYVGGGRNYRYQELVHQQPFGVRPIRRRLYGPNALRQRGDIQGLGEALSSGGFGKYLNAVARNRGVNNGLLRERGLSQYGLRSLANDRPVPGSDWDASTIRNNVLDDVLDDMADMPNRPVVGTPYDDFVSYESAQNPFTNESPGDWLINAIQADKALKEHGLIPAPLEMAGYPSKDKPWSIFQAMNHAWHSNKTRGKVSLNDMEEYSQVAGDLLESLGIDKRVLPGKADFENPFDLNHFWPWVDVPF